MTIARLVAEARGNGIELWFEGPKLRFRAPPGALTPALREAIGTQRDEVLAELRREAAETFVLRPMSYAQRGMWFAQLQAPTSSANTIGAIVHLSGTVDEEALQGMLQALMDRHETLRTTYILQDDEPVQCIAGYRSIDFHRVAMPGATDEEILEWVAAEQKQPFDLAVGPPIRYSLIAREGDWILSVTAHHIALDAWALAILLDESLALYKEFLGGQPAGLPRPQSYSHYAHWHNALLETPEGERMFESWREMLGPPLEPLALPLDRPRPATRSFEGDAVPFDLDADTVRAVARTAKECSTTPFALLLGCFHMTLAHLGHAQDVTVGIPVFGRNRSEHLGVVGDFVNSLPIRMQFDPRASAHDAISALGRTMVDALDAQEYPFALLVQRLAPARDASGYPFFNTFFTLIDFNGVGAAGNLQAQLTNGDGVDSAGMIARSWPTDRQAGLFDLSLELIESFGTIKGKLKFATDLFDKDSVERFAAVYLETIARVINEKSARVAGLIGIDEAAMDLLDDLATRDFHFSLDEGRLRINAPKGALDAGTRDAIGAHRDSIVAQVTASEGRKARLAAHRREAAIAFWQDRLAGVPDMLDLPADRQRTRASVADEAVFEAELPLELAERLRLGAQSLGVSLEVLLLAGWQALLNRLSGQEDIVVGLGDPDALVPIRSFADAETRFDTLVQQVGTAATEAREHSPAPVVDLLDEIAPDGSISASALFRNQFAFRAGGAPKKVAPLLPLRDIAVDVEEVGDALRVGYGFATALFDAATIARFHHYFVHLLADASLAPATPIRALRLYDDSTEAEVMARGAGPALAHDRGLCAHELFALCAADRSDAVAYSGVGGPLTYAEFERRANRLAQLLVSRGVTRGSYVAVCVERTVDMPVAMAAVLKAGAAYVPLDPSHPEARLQHIIADCTASCVITLARYAGMFDQTPLIRIDEDSAEIAAQDAACPKTAVTPDDLAYVIYTSGSTGKPKGVEVEHRNLVAFLEAMRIEPGIGVDDVVLAVTTPSFDIAGLELWLPLSVGARAVIASRVEAADGRALAERIAAEEVTILQATPATWQLLVDSGWQGAPGLKALCGGEAMPQVLARELLKRVGELWNMYGPTETTVWSLVARITDAKGAIPIGRPIAGTSVQVLDANNRPAPSGVVGELVIGGEGVARGYHDRPDLTSSVFVELPLAGKPQRLYRTGDLARFRDDGSVDYLGRRDLQVKVRGYRIELGEIEAQLSELPGIASGVVAMKSLGPGDERLVAYVTLEEGALLDGAAAREALAASLPSYMVPAHIVAVKAFPLSPSRKVDRSALPLPEGPRAGAASVPMTEAQARVAALWQTLLKAEHIGLEVNFFDLGGHSLLLVRLQAALEREFGTPVPLVELFQYTTVAAQAARMETAEGGDGALDRAQARAGRRHYA